MIKGRTHQSDSNFCPINNLKIFIFPFDRALRKMVFIMGPMLVYLFSVEDLEHWLLDIKCAYVFSIINLCIN